MEIVNHEELSSEEKVLFLGRCMDVVFGKSVNIVPDYYLRYEGDYDDFHLALWYRKRDVDGRATPVKLELDDEQIISFIDYIKLKNFFYA